MQCKRWQALNNNGFKQSVEAHALTQQSESSWEFEASWVYIGRFPGHQRLHSETSKENNNSNNSNKFKVVHRCHEDSFVIAVSKAPKPGTQ